LWGSLRRYALKRLGVRVSTVCPGVVQTPIYDSSRVVGFDKDRIMALWPKGITADACATRALRGVRRNEAMILVTPTAHLLWHMHRLAPRLFVKAAQGYIGFLRRARAV
jgi:short-subunit dehydrogenase